MFVIGTKRTIAEGNFDDFDRRTQAAELDYLRDSEAAQRTLGENYVGLPY